jgi:hypothetical protein
VLEIEPTINPLISKKDIALLAFDITPIGTVSAESTERFKAIGEAYEVFGSCTACS